jgi:hypothetical protein
MLSDLPEEILFKEICRYLNDKSKLSLHSTCKKFKAMRTYLTLDNDIQDFEDIIDSVYFNNFSRVRYPSVAAKRITAPKQITAIAFPRNLRELHIPTSRDIRYIFSFNRGFSSICRLEKLCISLVTTDLFFLRGRLRGLLRGLKSITIDTIKIIKFIAFPDTVENLIIRCKGMEYVRKKITLILPASLKSLKIKDLSKFNTESLSEYFSTNSSIHTLHLDSRRKFLGISNLPISLKKLYINRPLNASLCSLRDYSIEELILGPRYNY